MSLLDRNSSRIALREVVKGIDNRELAIVKESAGIYEVITALVNSRHSRMMYVVDESERLVGTISLGALTRHAFPHDREPSIHARSAMRHFSRESAGDIMRKRPVVGKLDETIGEVTRRMLKSNIKEIPVVSDDGKVIADVTIVDLLQHIIQDSAD